MGGVHNINVEYTDDVDGELALVYGPCGISSISEAHHQVGRTHIGSHPLAKRHLDWESQRPTKFVWIIPSEVSSGCLHAFSDGILVGRSETIEVTPAKLRRRGTFADVTDAMGPWFDGVAYLEQKQPDEAFVASVKNKTFGILGAGISGLMTSVSPPQLPPTARILFIARSDLLTASMIAASRLSWYQEMEDHRILRKARWKNQNALPQQYHT
jgi:hypothetical protein